MVPVVFLINLVVWICLISFFSILGSYEFLRALSSGNYSFFFAGMLYRSFYLIPLAVFLSFVSVYLFVMRHKTYLFISLPLALVLMVGSVLYIIPFSYRLMDHFEQFNPEALIRSAMASNPLLSPGYIRDDSSSKRAIWYSVSGDNLQAFPLVVADSSALYPGAETLMVYASGTYSPEKGNLVAGEMTVVTHAGGSDPLTRSSLHLPFFFNSVIRDVRTVSEHFHQIWKQDKTFYVWVAGGFGLSMFALWVICFATGWRLLNVVLLATCFRLLYFAYPFVYGEPVASAVREFLPSGISPALASPLVFAAFSGVLLLAALIVFIKRRIFHNGPEAFYD